MWGMQAVWLHVEEDLHSALDAACDQGCVFCRSVASGVDEDMRLATISFLVHVLPLCV